MTPCRLRDDYDPPEIDQPTLDELDDVPTPAAIHHDDIHTWCAHCWGPTTPDGWCPACAAYERGVA